MSGLEKATLGRNIFRFQTELYKKRSFFESEVETLPIRLNKKTTFLIKIREAIDNNLPTVAVAFKRKYDEIEESNSYILDEELHKYEKLANAPTNAIFLRLAFGSPDVAEFPQLSEKLYYLKEINHPIEEIRTMINEKITDIGNTKFSDFVGVALLMNSPKYYDSMIAIELDTFIQTSEYDFLYKYLLRINETDTIPNSFQNDVTKRYLYFAEGIRKWAFVDRNVSKKTREYVRAIALKTDDEIKDYFTNRDGKECYEDLKALANYVGDSSSYYVTLNGFYQFEG